MARFNIEGAIVDTSKAQSEWKEATRWNGNNHISVNSGSQWVHETLYLSAKGRYYIVHHSQWQGSLDSAEFITDAQAAEWLLRNEHPLPEALETFEKELCE